jgi:bifunctional DNA-binding transcriptional regulator/antitoxin component of YhaV-PrlF toxin-antitoxin module
MSTTLKTEIAVPKSIRRKAGFKPGEPVDFKVSNRRITIVPRLTPDELDDEREIHDPKIRKALRDGYREFLAGKTRPIENFWCPAPGER